MASEEGVEYSVDTTRLSGRGPRGGIASGEAIRYGVVGEDGPCTATNAYLI